MKAKIVIASTLKPVSEPRAFEKIARSLSDSGLYEVHIIGSLPTITQEYLDITLHPIFDYPSVFQRFLAGYKVWRKFMELKPKLVIITTHELLITGLLFKLFYGSKLFYDIQENYYLNLIYQHNYPIGIKHILGLFIRIKEKLTSPFINHFILAEKCYEDELSFINNRFIILENKFKKPAQQFIKKQQEHITFLLSGTISEAYGVMAALKFFRKLNTGEFKLIIIGHCPGKATFKMLEKLLAKVQNVTLEISPIPIPHKNILDRIGDKTIALLPYINNKSTANKVPTKLYEFIGLGVPIIISSHSKWDSIVKKYDAGLSIDFDKVNNSDELANSIRSIKYGQIADIKDIIWQNEKNKLLALINDQI